MLDRTVRFLGSLNLGLWLMAGVVVLMGIGSFASGEGASTINEMPLLAWLQEAPVTESWWLWLTVGLLLLLAVNTVVCSVQTVGRRYGQIRLGSLLAPQLMHLGFLLIMLAHLMSARWGQKGVMPVYEGQVIEFPDGGTAQIGRFSAIPGPMGMLADFSAELRYDQAGRSTVHTISPNHPFLVHGIGLYLKDLQLSPERAALVEIHREPGAVPALAGALLFTVGNIMLVILRRGRPLSGQSVQPDESDVSSAS